MMAILYNGFHCERLAHNLRRVMAGNSGYSAADRPEISQGDKEKL